MATVAALLKEHNPRSWKLFPKPLRKCRLENFVFRTPQNQGFLLHQPNLFADAVPSRPHECNVGIRPACIEARFKNFTGQEFKFWGSEIRVFKGRGIWNRITYVRAASVYSVFKILCGCEFSQKLTRHATRSKCWPTSKIRQILLEEFNQQELKTCRTTGILLVFVHYNYHICLKTG